MPTTYTHYRFGQDVLKVLPKPLRDSIQKNRQLYDIGVHGPDILFYYKVLLKNRINRIGVELHGEPGKVFFQQAAHIIKKSPDSAGARAYIYGFITHFALDSEIHKYVEKMIQVSGISHHEIETELDRHLLEIDQRQPLSHNRTKHIHPSKENSRVIAAFYPDITPMQIEKSLKGQIFIHDLLKTPTHEKRRRLLRAMKITQTYKPLHGLVMKDLPSDQNKEYSQILAGIYSSSVMVAASLILNFQKFLFENVPLSSRFDEDFEAGPYWRDINLER